SSYCNNTNGNEHQYGQCLTLINQATKQIKLLTQANKTFTIEALLVDIEQQLVQEFINCMNIKKQ
ncbi:hypothetical protein, partial [Thalassotalea sp. ND16A]|uniref:hypothetical protein n=1 Tax=Thalassotalea sp. ND16A TaxID=1535422 RepID=UPI000519F3E1